MQNSDKPSRVLAQVDAAVRYLAEVGAASAPDLAKGIGIPRPSAYRLMSALLQAGLASQAGDGTVALTTSWLGLSAAAQAAAVPWLRSEDTLSDLRDSTKLTVYLSVPRPGRTVCVRRLHGQGVQVLVLKPGGSLPLHLGGVGRVTLAFGAEPVEQY
ncbi:MAG TPA: helix-turn-helix domain-containing protein, partial [Naasia sp.]